MKIIKLKFYSYLINYNLRQKLRSEHRVEGGKCFVSLPLNSKKKLINYCPTFHLPLSLSLSLLFPALCAITFYRPQVEIPINFHASVARGIY